MASNLPASPEPEAQAPQQPTPNPVLRRLNRLVGTWNLRGRDFDTSGEITGQVTFEWLAGGFFLIQHFYINYIGQEIKGIEVIGYDPANDTFPSHIFDNSGNHLQYTYEVSDATITIWAGPKGSPTHMEGKVSEDGSTFSGRWIHGTDFPGTGYEFTGTRVR